MKKAKVIEFNSNIPEYAFLSAFYPAPFIAPLGKKMVLFPNREAYYQAHKTKSKEYRSKIINSRDPSRSKYFGSAKSGCPIVEGFDDNRKKIMRKAIQYQFPQNLVLMNLLMSTGKAELVELAPWDDYFGTGRDGEGKNVHGKLLMEFRDDHEKYGSNAKLAFTKHSDLYFYPVVKETR